MKKLTVLMVVLGICTTHLMAQDMFPAKRLTFEPGYGEVNL
jgi:hypothetical protein